MKIGFWSREETEIEIENREREEKLSGSLEKLVQSWRNNSKWLKCARQDCKLGTNFELVRRTIGSRREEKRWVKEENRKVSLFQKLSCVNFVRSCDTTRQWFILNRNGRQSKAGFFSTSTTNPNEVIESENNFHCLCAVVRSFGGINATGWPNLAHWCGNENSFISRLAFAFGFGFSLSHSSDWERSSFTALLSALLWNQIQLGRSNTFSLAPIYS